MVRELKENLLPLKPEGDTHIQAKSGALDGESLPVTLAVPEVLRDVVDPVIHAADL